MAGDLRLAFFVEFRRPRSTVGEPLCNCTFFNAEAAAIEVARVATHKEAWGLEELSDTIDYLAGSRENGRSRLRSKRGRRLMFDRSVMELNTTHEQVEENRAGSAWRWGVQLGRPTVASIHVVVWRHHGGAALFP